MAIRSLSASSSCGSVRIGRLHPGLVPAEGTSGYADEVTLSRKGAKSRTHGRTLRSKGTKSGTGAVRRKPGAELQAKLEAHARELEKKLVTRERELAAARMHLAETLEQQTATSEVLQLISSAPGELEPIFRTMLENATRMCGARFAVLFRHENGIVEPVRVARGAGKVR